MTRLLAIDSSTEACSVAVLSPTGIVQEYAVSPREHTLKLLPMVDRLFAQEGIALGQLDGIAYGCGPGSFTGLRIALSYAQGLAYSADLPLLPVSTLEAMAHGFVREASPAVGSIILPAIDARMAEVYWSAYRYLGRDANDQVSMMLEPVAVEQVASPQVLGEFVRDHQLIHGLGSGWGLSELPTDSLQSVTTEFYPQAYDIAVLATAALDRDSKAGIDALEATPVYLRDEVSWKKRTRTRQP